MGWDRRDAVGELLHEGDHVQVFRYRLGVGHSIVVDQEGCTVEDYEVGLGEVLREIFPTAQTFKLRWERFLEGDSLARIDQ